MDDFDLNDAQPQRDFSVIPPGLYQLRAMLKAAAVTDALHLAKNLHTKHLELELTVVGGEHDGRKLWDYVTLAFDDARYDDVNVPPVSPEQAEKYRTAVRLGRSRLKAIVDSAYGLNPNDKSDRAKEARLAISRDLLRVDGLTFWAQVDIRPGSNRL